MFDPDWHAQQLKLAEVQWEKVLNVVGVENVKEHLLKSNDCETLNIGVPYKAKNPVSHREVKIYPNIQYVIDWIDRKLKDQEFLEEKNKKRAIAGQWISLSISIIGLICVLANTMRSFLWTQP